MAKFRVGEIAIHIYDPRWPHQEQLCRVTGRARLFRRGYGPQDRLDWKGFFSPQYEVLDDDGEEWICVEDCLRKIQPPAADNTAGRWDECPWTPETVSAQGKESSHG